jgi:hypothetical protein
MSNPNGNPNLPKGKGRPKGAKNKTTEQGRANARSVIEQLDSDDDRCITNPVVRKLREQLREGVGPSPNQMPAAAFNALMDRAYGKVIDRVKLGVGARPFEGESDEDLAARADALRRKFMERRAARKEEVA